MKSERPEFSGEWETKRLSEIVVVDPENVPSSTDPDWSFNYISLEQVEDGRVRGFTEEVFRTAPSRARRILRYGDVLMSKVRPNLMSHLLYCGQIPNAVCSTGFAVLRAKPNRAVPGFIYAQLFARPMNDQVEKAIAGSNYPAVSSHDVSRFEIPYPPRMGEQAAIAAVLSDVDALLAALDTLIAKKRAIRKAAMQELLTGRTRLPGFSGEWEQKRLGDLGRFMKGSGVTRRDAQSGSLSCVRYGEIYTIHDTFIKDFHTWISAEVAASAVRVERGDLLFAGSGETKDDIGKCVALVDDRVAFAGGDIVILRLSSNDNPLFLSYVLNAHDANRQKASFGQGDAIVHITAAALAQVVVGVPPVPEQLAIAGLLYDMDSEIAALMLRRRKTCAIKRGMMQQLLTGKTRLAASATEQQAGSLAQGTPGQPNGESSWAQ